MSNALGDRSSTKILTAEQLGTPSNHVKVAYIDSIIPAPPFTEDLQATCDIGNTTTTPINCESLNVTGGAGSAYSIVTFDGIKVNSGGITLDEDDLVVNDGTITVANGDIDVTVGSITVAAGDIVATAGSVIAGTTVTAGTGITATAGDITATAGGIIANGNSLLNRVQYNTYYGGSSYTSPIALSLILPYVAFTLPADTYTFVLFATHAVSGSASFPFELHTSLTDVMKDYSLIVSGQTANNNGAVSIGYSNIVSGDSVSDPTNKSKITVIVNTAVGATTQVMKFIVKLVYSPSP